MARSPPGFWDKTQQTGNMKAFLTKSALNANYSEGWACLELTPFAAKKCRSTASLRDKGISAKDERKVLALRDSIFKQAHAIKA